MNNDSPSMTHARAYYNEIDAYRCQWLRNLINARLLPPGDVDQRDIKLVKPEDLHGYTQAHFFAGIGGWPWALQLAHWPDERPIWTGSCPCQPFSVSGNRMGVRDPRHLWPHFYRLIRVGRPHVVMGEQVSGADGYKWLDGVVSDFAKEDYEARAVDIPSCTVNSPNIRNRLYWIAQRVDQPTETRRIEAGCEETWEVWDETWGEESERRSSICAQGVANAESAEWREESQRWDEFGGKNSRREEEAGGSGMGGEGSSGMADARRKRNTDAGETAYLEGKESSPKEKTEEWEWIRNASGNSSSVGRLEHPLRPRLEIGQATYNQLRAIRQKGTPAIPPSPGNFWARFQLIGPDEEGFYRRIEPTTLPLAPRIPTTMARLRAIGDAINPEIAAEVIRAWMACTP